VRLIRPLAIVLAVMVSPVGMAVCEVVCGSPLHAAGHAQAALPAAAAHEAHAHHDHHGHHTPPAAAPAAPASDADGVMSLPGPECEPLSGIPARVRSTFSGPDLQTSAIAQVVTVVDMVTRPHQRLLVADVGPPEPPRHAPVPLRI